MLFVLTGDVQIGKTRWLATLVRGLECEGVRCFGVLSPGDWRPRPEGIRGGADAHGLAGVGEYEKFGIFVELLPGSERFSFARRGDLAVAEGAFDASSQAARAQLGWAIDDAAIARVNDHFRLFAPDAGETGAPGAAGGSGDAPGLLVVDELGRLELVRGEGFSSAVSVLDGGPTAAFPHALVVVRSQLFDIAAKRFADTWGGLCVLSPDVDARLLVRGAYGLR